MQNGLEASYLLVAWENSPMWETGGLASESLNFVASVWEVNQEMEGLSLSLTHSVNLPF